MINRENIESRLKDLNRLYLDAHARKVSFVEPLYFSKLAIMELCGWIEDFADEVVLEIVEERLVDPEVVSRFKDRSVKAVHGVHYERHFRRLLQATLGEVAVHEIECKMGEKREILEIELNNLSILRNALAHTYITETKQRIEAPSFTLTRFHLISECLEVLESQVNSHVQNNFKIC